ncbi:phosphate transport system substrate-binding protein [Altererythrobacter atlanticus]|uniref:Phosphate-binding protein PstS n=1 Tax=Croceibacterium atlanticum TaxID=1267766 RepID=A0A0F7KRS1_9SPHN|nr:substrate-binding domain-containing protein [Croceibacterium atlanticum]AKH41445.1 Phosphate-binding protein PstS precursor [Croceibacterium atlanticum]MBB5732907.1 phosphate transport system substrate-binding protein [Croceibacterium atlanticum]
MIKKLRLPFVALGALALASCGGSADGGGTRESIRAVGSSTVYPFAKSVAEMFARSHPEYKSPIIESTGTGGGVNLFCEGLGADTPDIVNASRRMKPSEFATCQQNGVGKITEIQIGLDGIAFASSKGGISMNLTPEIVYRALAASPYGEEQTARTWSDVDPSLPNEPILVYGPPSTSGTRDALKELVLEKGCEANPAMEAIKESDEARFQQICTEVRSDGSYVDQGEQDNLIVQKIEGNPQAVGVFGFSYLEENADRVQGLRMNGVEPTYANISNFSYPGARPLYIYVKNGHLDAIPGLRDFIAAWADAWVKDGPLTSIGLVANPDDAAAKSAAAATEFTPLTAADFE